jgi:hypothetical protein
VILASADQVAIDAVAAKLMGFDPMSIKFIRLAHEKGLGVGRPEEIELVGDAEAGAENWRFDGPYKRLTFAARMQHAIYWGGLKGFLEWSLKTWLAPWAYIASVVYHDWYWYPRFASRQVREALAGDWGKLFQNWDRVTPDADGWADVGSGPPTFVRGTGELLAMAWRVLKNTVREAPEIAARRRRKTGAL